MKHIEEYEELYRAWIGEKNQDKYFEGMKNGGFSWIAFLLSDLFLITRKMFVESIILIIFVCIIAFVCTFFNVPQIIYNIIALAIAITLGASFYHLYRWNIKRKIIKYQNKGLTYEKQLEIAKKYGGDKITLKVILVFILEFIILTFFIYGSAFLLTKFNFLDKIPQQNNHNVYNENNQSGYTNSIYNENNQNGYTNSIYSENNQSGYTNNIYNGNNINSSIWNLGTFNLNYNPNYWKISEYENKEALQFNNTKNYLLYAGSQKIEDNKGIDVLKEEKNRETIGNALKEQLEAMNNMQYLYSNWTQVNDELYLFKIECTVEDNENNENVNAQFYCYFSNNNIYMFLALNMETNYSFNYELEDVLDTLKNNPNL